MYIYKANPARRQSWKAEEFSQLRLDDGSKRLLANRRDATRLLDETNVCSRYVLLRSALHTLLRKRRLQMKHTQINTFHDSHATRSGYWGLNTVQYIIQVYM